MSMYSIGCVSSPAASSTAMTPSSDALWASAGPVHEVADRVDALDRGAQRAVDLDQPVVVELDAGLLEPEALDVGAAAGGDDEPVDLGLLVAEGEADTLSSEPRRSRPACRCGSSCSAWRARGRRPWRCRRPRSAARGRAPRTAAPRCRAARTRRRSRRRRRPRRRPRSGRAAPRAPTPPRCRSRGRRTRCRGSAWDRAGGEDHALRGLDLGPVEVPADLHVAVVGDRAEALDVVDLVLLEQPADAAGERLDDLPAALARPRRSRRSGRRR